MNIRLTFTEQEYEELMDWVDNLEISEYLKEEYKDKMNKKIEIITE